MSKLSFIDNPEISQSMIYKQILTIAGLLILTACKSSGQSFEDQFKSLVQKKDTSGELQLLLKWKEQQPNDPELYVSWYNFYVNKSIVEMLGLEKTQAGDESLQLTNTDSKEVAYINQRRDYKSVLLNTGFSYIDTGIIKFPKRLDMRFGKIYMLGELKDHERFTNEIIKTIDFSAVIKNKWEWKNGNPVDDAEKFMLGTIQSYILQLYNTNDDALLNNMKSISETVLKYYPDNVENLSDLSIVYLINKDYDKALEPLLKAEKIAPNDYIVLSNIAKAYNMKGDNKNAIKYYELTLKYGDEQAKQYATKQLSELQKK